LARQLANGEYVFVGRADYQVKVRGFRIELGEIEAALAEQAGVREAVVAVWEEGVNQRLVAYVVGRAGITGGELRRALRQWLPEYITPALYVMLEALPLNSNGKIDRRALPRPALEGEEEKGVYVAPRTAVEEKLAQIWAAVLNLERVGVDDNFFARGGHSLLATQVISRIKSVFQVEAPLRRLFEAPTVAGLAKIVEQLMQEAGAGPTQASIEPAIKRAARKTVKLPL